MGNLRLPQVWHPVEHWEEISHNMWGKVNDRSATELWAVEFTGDHVQYGRFMHQVCIEWPVSTENAFTDPHLNHRAWLGYAACALAGHCPEDIVRQAWRYLSDEQKLLANKEASREIAAWRRSYVKDRGLHSDLGTPMLPGFDS